jgi:hypothetical protein
MKIANKIYIKENKYTDPKTKDKLDAQTKQHIMNVGAILGVANMIMLETGENHDWTKTEFLDDFYKNNIDSEEGMNFKDGEWYKGHMQLEDHHPQTQLNKNTINLWNIFEMIADCIDSGLGRYGEIDMSYFELSDEVLQAAYKNTVEILINHVELIPNDEEEEQDNITEFVEKFGEMRAM